MKKHIRSKKVWIATAIIAALFIIYFLRHKDRTIVVTSYPVSKKDVVKTISAAGKTAADKNLEIKSLVTAQVAKINFNSGDLVKEGDVVIVYDKYSLNAAAASLWSAYLSAKAAKDSYQTQVMAAQKDLDEKRYRRDTLKNNNGNDNGYTATDDLNTAQSAVDDAQSVSKILQDKKSAVSQAVDSSYLSYVSAQKNLINGEVKSPATGFLALDNVLRGSSVTAGQTLFKISNSNFMQFVSEVDETDIQFVKPNQTAVVTLDAYPNIPFAASVMRLDVQTRKNDSGSTIIEVLLDLKLGDVRPIIGASGNASISIDTKANQLAVPLDSVLYDTDKNYYVYKITQANGQYVAKKTQVKVAFEGDEFYAVAAGLQEGDAIAVGDNFSKLTDGAKISFNKNQ